MRLMMIMLLFVLLALPTSMHAHGTDLIGGRVEMHGDGEVMLVLEVTPARLELFTQPRMVGLCTWGDVRVVSADISQEFSAALRLRCGPQELPPTTVRISPLLGAYPPSDSMRLPEFVPVTVIWKAVPAGPREVVAHFTLPTCNLILVLENAKDVIGVDNGEASSDPTAAALVGSKQPPGARQPAPAQRNVEP